MAARYSRLAETAAEKRRELERSRLQDDAFNALLDWAAKQPGAPEAIKDLDARAKAQKVALQIPEQR